ncbi:hypothetical protein ACXQE7_13120, partial [Staphylococcus argenteus]
MAWQRSTLAERKFDYHRRYGPFLTCGNRLLLSSSSALAYSFSSTKLVALASRFVRFKRFHFAKPFFFVLIF